MAEGKDEQQRSHFEQVPVDLLEDTDLTESELVFYVLIVGLSHDKGYCHAMNKTLGDIRGKNLRTVQRVIDSLRKKEYIRVSFVDYVNEQGNQYKQRRLFPLKYVKTDVGGMTKLSWVHDRNVMGARQNCHGGTTEMSGIPMTKMSGNDNNNKRNIYICANDDLRTSSPSHSESDKHKAAEQKKENLFSQFWAAYPKKRGKVAAKRAFLKVKHMEQAFPVMMKALERQKVLPDWQKDGGQYIPYPSTWLNGERWQDDLNALPPAAPSSRSSWGGRSAAGEISEAEQRARDEAARRAAGFDD